MVLKYNRDKQFQDFYTTAFSVDSVQQFLFDRINSAEQLHDTNRVNKVDWEAWKIYQGYIINIASLFGRFFELMYNYLDSMDDKDVSLASYLQLEEYIVEKMYIIFDAEKCSAHFDHIYKNKGVRRVDVDNFVTFYHQISLNVFHTIHSSFLMDMYVVVRLLKNKDSDMIVLYAGMQHCSILYEILSKYFGYTPYCVMPLQVDTKFNPIRCLDLGILSTIGDMNFPDLLLSKKL